MWGVWPIYDSREDGRREDVKWGKSLRSTPTRRGGKRGEIFTGVVRRAGRFSRGHRNNPVGHIGVWKQDRLSDVPWSRSRPSMSHTWETEETFRDPSSPLTSELTGHGTTSMKEKKSRETHTGRGGDVTLLGTSRRTGVFFGLGTRTNRGASTSTLWVSNEGPHTTRLPFENDLLWGGPPQPLWTISVGCQTFPSRVKGRSGVPNTTDDA